MDLVVDWWFSTVFFIISNYSEFFEFDSTKFFRIFFCDIKSNQFTDLIKKYSNKSRAFMSFTEAVDTWIKLGIEVLISYSVCSLIPPFVLRNVAHQNTLKHKSMVVESKAYTFPSMTRRKSLSVMEAFLARSIRWKAYSSKILQSRFSLALAKLDLEVPFPNPR